MKHFLLFLLANALFVATFSGCKKDSDDDDNDKTGTDYVLVIENGARSINLDASVQYTAFLVSKEGAIVTPESVSWSSSESSVASISAGGLINVLGVGVVKLTATAQYQGKTYTASVPLGINNASVFAVAPSAIIWGTDAGPIQLETVYFGLSTPTYSFSSSNSGVASVSSTGLVSFSSIGECTITVTANIGGESYQYLVPVLVVGEPSVPLPVSRVAVTPAASDIFRGDNLQLSAKAYNSAGAEVSGTFDWSVSDPTVASINSSGLLTANSLGQVTVYARTQGIIGQAEVIVNPDTFVIVNPMTVSLAAGATRQFTADVYKIDRITRNVSQIPSPPGLTWEIPTYGISILDIATVNSTGLVTMKNDAQPGLATFLLAGFPSSPSIDPGAALIQVAIGTPGGCSDCDNNANASVASIAISPTTYNLSLFGNPTVQLNPEARDAGGNPVAGVTFGYCSDNIQVANADGFGNLTAVSDGTATITICVGTVSTTITVNVTF